MAAADELREFLDNLKDDALKEFCRKVDYTEPPLVITPTTSRTKRVLLDSIICQGLTLPHTAARSCAAFCLPRLTIQVSSTEFAERQKSRPTMLGRLGIRQAQRAPQSNPPRRHRGQTASPGGRSQSRYSP